MTDSKPPAPSLADELAGILKQPAVRRLAIATAVLVVCFALPLYSLVRIALGSSLYSHIVLIPIVSIGLAWIRRGRMTVESAPNRVLAGLFFLLGGGALAGWWAVAASGVPTAIEDRLALSILPLLLLFVGACAWFLGRATLRVLAFPLSFLVFMMPFPVVVEHGIEMFFQHTSAPAAAALFRMAGTPLLRMDLILQLPGITLEVARECSGIRSSLVLFIVSLVAGDLMLRSRWKRVLLVVFVIPLGIVRNAFRIFVLGQLCVYDDPAWIHSPLHHQGGPIFFALSLIPMFIFVWLLVRWDRFPQARKP